MVFDHLFDPGIFSIKKGRGGLWCYLGQGKVVVDWIRDQVCLKYQKGPIGLVFNHKDHSCNLAKDEDLFCHISKVQVRTLIDKFEHFKDQD